MSSLLLFIILSPMLLILICTMFEAEFWFEFDTFLISGDFCNIEVCSNGFSEISISKDSFCFL